MSFHAPEAELSLTEEKTYKIGEVAQMLHLKAHVLRFWETVFPQIDPIRTDTGQKHKGQRLYTASQVALLRRIQQLLHEQGMTIEGAKRVLDGNPAPYEDDPERPPQARDPEFVGMVTKELLAIQKLLEFAGPK